MTVTVPSGSSTDKRLDDLNRKVDAGFVRLEGDIRDLRTETIGIRAEFKAEMEGLRTEISGEVDSTRTEVKGAIDGLRTEMLDLRTELKGDIVALRGEMNARFKAVEARFDSLQRTLFGGAVAIVAALIGSSAFG